MFCGSSFAKQFHQATFHGDPQASWCVKQKGNAKKVDGYPLVIGIVNWRFLKVEEQIS